MIAVLNAVLAKHLQIIVLYVRLHLLKLELLYQLVTVKQDFIIIPLVVNAGNVTALVWPVLPDQNRIVLHVMTITFWIQHKPSFQEFRHVFLLQQVEFAQFAVLDAIFVQEQQIIVILVQMQVIEVLLQIVIVMKVFTK